MSRKSSFAQGVYQFVRQIPKGRVATYGWLAAKLGKPQAARAVGNALHRNPDPATIPCHRVVNREGGVALSFSGAGWREHKRKLVAEGVEFKGEKQVDLDKHQWLKPI